MKNHVKKSLSFFLVFAMLIPLCISAFAVQTDAKLYGVYADGMLFKQNEEAIVAGTAEKGSKITLDVRNSSGEIIASNETVAENDGIFEISFNAPEGSFEEYTITLFQNGTAFEALDNVVFGEVWLASGQSNMAMPLGGTVEGMAMQRNNVTVSKWIRFLQLPDLPVYNGSAENIPAFPLDDVEGCRWFNGESGSIYGFSAVAFNFAEELFNSLDMPLGVIQSALGGSSIASWLPREAIDADEKVKEYIKDDDKYIELSEWNKKKIDPYTDMTANYNNKIHPLRNFKLSGMIWYQGETDIIMDSVYGEYTAKFNLLQKTYSELFGFDGLLPIVYTQIASYCYGDDFRLQLFNDELSRIQQISPGTRAVSTIYDVPLDYDAVMMSIHPTVKAPVGERMAFAAAGLVYGKHNTYTAAYPETVTASENCLTIKLKNTGDGLASDGEVLKGFAVCGEDGIYFPANAEIISKDTVKLTSPSVKNPVSATYALSQTNARSNLYSSIDGTLFPVSPFITDRSYTYHLWKDNGWTDCDTDEIWRSERNEYSGLYKTWQAENAQCKITADSAYSGDAGLNVTSTAAEFSVSPVMLYPNGEIMDDIDENIRDYKLLSFKIRNNGTEEIKFTSMVIDGKFISVSPCISGESSCGTSIPADGAWHTVTLDLNRLCFASSRYVAAMRINLEKISSIKLSFENANGESSDLSIDEFGFFAQKETNTVYDILTDFCERIIRYLNSVFIW